MYGFKILFFIEYICSLSISCKYVVYCIPFNIVFILSHFYLLPDTSLIKKKMRQ